MPVLPVEPPALVLPVWLAEPLEGLLPELAPVEPAPPTELLVEFALVLVLPLDPLPAA